MRRKVLKLKHLFDIELTAAPEASAGRCGRLRCARWRAAPHCARPCMTPTLLVTSYICPSCKADIAFKQTYALRRCSHVICERCAKHLALPDSRCPVCSTSLKEKDCVQMETGGAACRRPRRRPCPLLTHRRA